MRRNPILQPEHLATLTPAALRRIVIDEAEALTAAWTIEVQTASDASDMLDDAMLNLVRLQRALLDTYANSAYSASVVERTDDIDDAMAEAILANVVAA